MDEPDQDIAAKYSRRRIDGTTRPTVRAEVSSGKLRLSFDGELTLVLLAARGLAPQGRDPLRYRGTHRSHRVVAPDESQEHRRAAAEVTGAVKDE